MRKTCLGLSVYVLAGLPFVVMAQSTKTVTVDGLVAELGKPELRKAAVQELRNKGYGAFKALKSVAKNSKKGRDERVAAILLAGDIVKLSTAATVSDRDGFRKDAEGLLSGDKDDFVREASALALGKFGDKSAIATLKKSLTDKNANVRMRSAWALARVGDNSGADAALKMLDTDDAGGQFVAIEALGEIGDPLLLPELEKRASSTNQGTRICAILAINRVKMKKLSGEERIKFLAQSLADEQAEVAQWAAKTLASEVMNGGEHEISALTALKKFSADKSNRRRYLGMKWLNYLVEERKIIEENVYK